MNEVNVIKGKNINKIDKLEIDGKEVKLHSENEFNKPILIIYVYMLPKFKAHGFKVGMTTCKPNQTYWDAIYFRVKEQKNELNLKDEDYQKYGNDREVIFWLIALDANSESFKDYFIHKKVVNEEYAGFAERSNEWIHNVPESELKQIILKARSERKKKSSTYTLRKEQKKCIEKIEEYFENNLTGKFLINCKMRFGKCFTTYKYCENKNLKKILILTFVPAVEKSWKDDLDQIKTDYKYLTNDDIACKNFDLKAINKNFVLFLSLQNFLGKDKDSQDIKEKIQKLKGFKFDLIIFDEYHFGAWNDNTKDILEDLDDKVYLNEIKNQTYNDILENKFNISSSKILCLSGTPFKALAKGEFDETNTFTYSYFDEQRAKYPNGRDNLPSKSHKHFPDLKIFGYDMKSFFKNDEGHYFFQKSNNKDHFSLNKFFETKNENSKFIFTYEEHVNKWLKALVNRTVSKNMPYMNVNDGHDHALWTMPTIHSCNAMADLLKNDEYFNYHFEIINLSSSEAGSGKRAHDYLMSKINAAKNSKKGSITLTVNKLTLGSTVHEWSKILVLKDLTSPEQYFQTIFRIQTPWIVDNKIVKKEGIVYDFNIDRAASLLLRYAENSIDNFSDSKKHSIVELITTYLPIYTDGSIDNPIDKEVFLQLAIYGSTISKQPLSQRITNMENATYVHDDEILSQIINDPKTNPIIKKIFAHSKFGKNKNRFNEKNTMPSSSNEQMWSVEYKNGLKSGKELGYEKAISFKNIIDSELQSKYDKLLQESWRKKCPSNYTEDQRCKYQNGFAKGYETGIKSELKKMYSGKEDGKKFVKHVKKEFGENIKWNKWTEKQIKQYINEHLEDEDNIPNEYKVNSLYSKWYKDSFKNAIKRELEPKIDGDVSLEKGHYSIQHLLARLFQFLYISVYREKTFNEIFQNADKDIFLEAVGITKEEFEELNKYQIFNEKYLDGCIEQFFINEELGSTLHSNDDIQRYRNSFGWFGFNQIDENK